MAKRPLSIGGANIYLIVACNLSRLSIAGRSALKKPYIYLFANPILEVRFDYPGRRASVGAERNQFWE
jgi:hypothetical protein